MSFDGIRAHVRHLLASPTFRIVSGAVGGSLLGTSIALLGTIVQARYVGPEDLGYFRQFAIAANYVFLLHVGILNALQRLYPYYIGQGQRGRAMALVEICQAWSVSVASLASCAFALLGVRALCDGNWRATLGWAAQAVAIMSILYGGYLGATYRSGHDFTTAAKNSVFNGLVGLVVLPFFAFWPYVTLTLRSCLTGLTSLAYLHVHRPLRIPWRFNWREWRALAREGLPMFAASYGTSVGWSAVEASLILRYLGSRSLGLWSASFMVFELANKLPQTISAVYAPRLIEHYGRTGSVRECLRMCRKPIVWGGAALAIVMTATLPLLPFMVRWLMPKYTEAIVPMCLMMLCLPLFLLEMPSALLVAQGHLAQQNIAAYGALACFAVCFLVAVHLDWGLNGAVIALVLGRLARIALVFLFIAISLRQADAR